MSSAESQQNESEPRPAFKWGFGRAALVILSAMITGQVLGTIVDNLTLVPGRFGAREWVLVFVLAGFVVSAGLFLFLQRAAVTRFFRTMNVGVALVSMTLLAVFAGVLVPQIESFEDPTERIPSIGDIGDDVFYAYLALPDERNPDVPRDQRALLAAQAQKVLARLDQDQRDRLWKYRDEFQKFRWAEGYFLYHLFHPYGIGMPKAPPLMPQMKEGLDRFEKKYGKEERQNREKSMHQAMNGRPISQAIGASIREHQVGYRRAFDVVTALSLNRTYKSHWFLTLMCMLFTGVAFNTFKGAPASWLSTRKVGYVTVHMGVMTILIGGAISKSQTTRGLLQLELDKPPENEFWGFNDPQKLRYLPFWVQLDRFARRDWKTLQVGFPDEKFTSNLPEYTLWPGRKVDLDFAPDKDGVERPRIRLEVLSVHERAHVPQMDYDEAGVGGAGDTIGPQAIMTLTRAAMAEDGAKAGAMEDSHKLQLSPLGGQRRLLHAPGLPYRLAVDWSEDPAHAKKIVQDVVEGQIGWLSTRVAVEGGIEPTFVPVKIGDTIEAAGGYTVKVVRAVPAFAFDRKTMQEVVDPRPIAEQFPSNPAVFLEIRSKAGGAVEERPVLQRLDYEEAGLQKGLEFPDLVVNFVWDRWMAPGPERYVLHWDNAKNLTLFGPDGAATTVKVGERLPLPGDLTKLVLDELFVNARIQRNIVLDPAAPVIDGPHFDETFYSHEPTGVEIKVTTNPDTDAAHSETVVMASTDEGFANEWLAPDRRFYLRYFHNDRAFPFEWRSVLSVWETDADGRLYKVDTGPEWDREIRVNDYFSYKPPGPFTAGYRFFQSNADARMPTYSGIGVVYDPGIPFVLLGMYVSIIGAIMVFILRPIAEHYGKRKKQGATA